MEIDKKNGKSFSTELDDRDYDFLRDIILSFRKMDKKFLDV